MISKDSKIRLVEVQLPGHSVITRSINHAYPLELPEKADELVKSINETNVSVKVDKLMKDVNESVREDKTSKQRNTFIQARETIQKCVNDNFTTNLFCFPWEC